MPVLLAFLVYKICYPIFWQDIKKMQEFPQLLQGIIYFFLQKIKQKDKILRPFLIYGPIYYLFDVDACSGILIIKLKASFFSHHLVCLIFLPFAVTSRYIPWFFIVIFFNNYFEYSIRACNFIMVQSENFRIPLLNITIGLSLWCQSTSMELNKIIQIVKFWNMVLTFNNYSFMVKWLFKLNIYCQFIFLYYFLHRRILKNKTQQKLKKNNTQKRLCIDRRTNLLQVLPSLFQMNKRILGLVDQDGTFYDINQFNRFLGNLKSDQLTLITEEQLNTKRSELQTSLKYSQISDFGNRLTFIDFVYDVEEFQCLLSGEFTCIFLVDERDSSWQPLVNNYNNWIQFYYSFTNRMNLDNKQKMLWIYKGSKKIVQLLLNNDKKMKQMDDLMQKLVSTKQRSYNSHASNTHSSPFRSNHSPERRGKRSKSIRRLVEETQSSVFQPSRLVTKVQARFTHRMPSAQDEYQQYEDISQHNQSSESLLNIQDQLFQLVGDLEDKEILDISASRLLKRMLLEENKEVIQTLYSLQTLWYIIQIKNFFSDKIFKIIEHTQQQQRPNSPFQNLKNGKPLYVKEQQHHSVQNLKEQIFNQYQDQFTPEQYGMGMILFKQEDQTIINLTNDIYHRLKRDPNPNLMALQVYTENKFNQLLEQHFTQQQIKLIHDSKNKRTSAVYAVINCFKFDQSEEELIRDLKQAVSISQNQVQPVQSKEISLFKQYSESPKAPPPTSVIMENFNIDTQQVITQHQQYIKQHNEQQQIQLIQQIQQQELIQLDHKVKEKTISAKEVIFEEEKFMELKLARRQQNQQQIDLLFSNQIENDLQDQFIHIIQQLDFDQEKINQLQTLFDNYDNKLYDIIKDHNLLGSIIQTKQEIQLLFDNNNERDDYRKVKLFNLFINSVRQFYIQKHITESERNFLYKLFVDRDLQVLGALESYLQKKSDAQDFLENLQLIVRQYAKHINIQSEDMQIKLPEKQKRLSDARKKLSSKDIIANFGKYFSGDEKLKLEMIASDQKDNRIELLHDQYKTDKYLTGFINEMKTLAGNEILRKNPNWIEQLVRQLKKDGQLVMENFLVDLIIQNRNEPRIKGVFEFYQHNQSVPELIESLKFISKIIQKGMFKIIIQEHILSILEEFGAEQNWNEQKLSSLRDKVRNENSALYALNKIYNFRKMNQLILWKESHENYFFLFLNYFQLLIDNKKSVDHYNYFQFFIDNHKFMI
ncbi:hypothetical protein pb186bvf_013796 [Paramecium bursaria]